MTFPPALFNRLFRTPEEGKIRKILLAPLGFFSFLYGRMMDTRAWLYRKGFYRSHSLACQVVSVGNITLGGTGKTPFVALLAGWMRDRGLTPAVLSRGYKGRFSGPYGIVSDGKRVLLDAIQAGDEPYFLAEKLKGVPVIVGSERRVTGRIAVEHFHANVVILDDGFQHLSLKRNLNFLLIDASCPFGNGKVFPRGPLREPMGQIGRADALILTKVEGDGNIQILNRKLADRGVGIPVFRTEYRPYGIRALNGGEILPLENLQGKKVLAFSGIAQPESFRRTLRGLNCQIVEWETFPDHYQYRQEDVNGLQDRAFRAGAEVLVTTEKDMVRIKSFSSGPVPVWALCVNHAFRENDGARFEAFLRERMDFPS